MTSNPKLQQQQNSMVPEEKNRLVQNRLSVVQTFGQENKYTI
jgi:hypothetical protein